MMNSENKPETKQAAALFYRDGRAFTSKPQYDEKGKPYSEHQEKCSRCGGAGGAEQWRHTGWTCFDCGGNGKGRIVVDKLYTAEQISKLNAIQEKRNAKRAAAIAEKQAALAAEREARRTAFEAEHQAYFNDVLEVCGVGSFAHEIIATAIRLAELTDKQRAALDRMVTETKAKAAASYVGTIGERREFTCKLEKFFDWSNVRSFPRIYKYCHIMRDENGNCIKYIGSTVLGGVTWERVDEYSRDTYPKVDSSVVLKFKATIEAHEEYKGEKQTIVKRPKLTEEA